MAIRTLLSSGHYQTQTDSHTSLGGTSGLVELPDKRAVCTSADHPLASILAMAMLTVSCHIGFITFNGDGYLYSKAFSILSRCTFDQLVIQSGMTCYNGEVTVLYIGVLNETWDPD